MSPLFRWSANDLPIIFQSKRQIRATNVVLMKHYKAQVKTLSDLREALAARDAYIEVLENAAESDLRAFEDVLKAEMALAAELAELKRLIGVLLNHCVVADATRASEGRAGRVGTRAIRELFGATGDPE